MKEGKDIWFENLPEGCPPSDAEECCGRYYRIASGNPVKACDFFSQRMMQPLKDFGEINACIARSLSLFDTLEAAERRLKLPKFKQARIVSVDLSSEDGVIKKTFGKSHYSWWRTKNFDISKAKMER